MKKKRIATLVAACLLGVSCNAFAEVSPFSDVPSDHWAYESLIKLVNQGVITNTLMIAIMPLCQ